MKNNDQKNLSSSRNSPNSTPSKGAVNPGKPNNNPDQTPKREVQNVPTAKPGTGTPEKSKMSPKK